MNADTLMATWMLDHYLSGGSVGEYAVTSVNADIHPLSGHWRDCPGPITVAVEAWDGPLSDVTPDPEAQIDALVSCPHSAVVKTPQGSVDRGPLRLAIRAFIWLPEMLASMERDRERLERAWGDRVEVVG